MAETDRDNLGRIFHITDNALEGIAEIFEQRIHHRQVNRLFGGKMVVKRAKADIRRLGTQLGNTLVRQHGPDLLDAVERAIYSPLYPILFSYARHVGETQKLDDMINGRIEDLREVAKVMEGRKVKEGLRAMIVPGSGLVRAQAEEEGIAQQLIDAGFEWRMAGCSMCLAMNPDQLAPGERCASTSNRNFEGRQGRGGRTHLLSPAMAAAAAVTGKLTDVRDLV